MPGTQSTTTHPRAARRRSGWDSRLAPEVAPRFRQHCGNLRKPVKTSSHNPCSRTWPVEVDVILDITAKVPHVFQSFTHILDEADHALDRAAPFLRQHVRA